MRRRQFIVFAGGAVVALLPLAADAQPAQKRRVAVLMGGLKSGDASGQAEAAALEDGLKELGWKVGGNIELDYHWPGAELDAVRAAASEIASSRPELVVSRSTPATAAMMNSGLPIIFVLVVDPLGSGFVQTLGHPGYNLTGFSNFEASVAGKWLGLLKEAAPSVSRVAMLFNPTTAPFASGYLNAAQVAAPGLGVTFEAAPCANTADIENAVTALARNAGGGLIVITDTFLTEYRDFIVALATRLRLPAVYGSSTFVASGGMVVYSADYPDIYRRAAGYVDRVLHGARPGELPVQEPAKYSLTLNLKTARAIGLALPQPLIARADEVIE
jgi:putative ABC transport system substrate-binding protein